MLIVALFSAGLFLTQCSDDCGEYNYSHSTPIGLSSARTSIQSLSLIKPSSDIDSFAIVMNFDFLYAKHNQKWSMLNTAYACSPPPVPSFDASPFIDSIRVFSDPTYVDQAEVTDLLIHQKTTELTDFNNASNRTILDGQRQNFFFLNKPPTQSDSFSFSFYYYKDGAIIDSSFTQKHFISSQ